MNIFKKKNGKADAPCEATKSVNHALEAIDAGMKVKREARNAAQKIAESLAPAEGVEPVTAKK